FIDFDAGHHFGAEARDGHARSLRHERNSSRGPWVNFKYEYVIALYCILNIHQTYDAQFQRHSAGLLLQIPDERLRQGIRRQGAGAVAGMRASLFDMLHDSGYENIDTVANGVHIDFNSVLKIVIQQQRFVFVYLYLGRRKVEPKPFFISHDLHGPPAENIGWT